MSPRILHVCTRYCRGGSEQRLRDYVGAVDADHTVVVGRDSDLDQARADLRCASVERWDELIRTPQPLTDLRVLARLRNRLRTGAFDLVCTHQSKAGLVGRLAARLTATPALHSVSMANTGPGYGPLRSAAFSAAERTVASAASGYAVVGDDLRRRICANGVDPGRCVIVRSGARLPAGTGSRSERRARLEPLAHVAHRPWVVSVGSLEPRKNAARLPELHARVRELTPELDPVLVLAGDGPDLSAVELEIQRLELAADIILVGHVDWAPELIAAADVLVLMSNAEGLPQVLVQAAAANTPYACFEVDGARELALMGARGSISRPGAVDDLASATAMWLRRVEESTAPLIDLGSWAPDAIAAGYRELTARVLGGERASR